MGGVGGVHLGRTKTWGQCGQRVFDDNRIRFALECASGVFEELAINGWVEAYSSHASTTLRPWHRYAVSMPHHRWTHERTARCGSDHQHQGSALASIRASRLTRMVERRMEPQRVVPCLAAVPRTAEARTRRRGCRLHPPGTHPGRHMGIHRSHLSEAVRPRGHLYRTRHQR